MADTKTTDAKTYEERKEFIREESSPSHKDGREFPSSDDVVAGSGGLSDPETDVPDTNGRASDVEDTPGKLHGSLHGRWNATGEAEE